LLTGGAGIRFNTSPVKTLRRPKTLRGTAADRGNNPQN
jgi:hypothetical protein